MKTLLVPTDFSPVSTNAMHYAVNMALAIDASILLFHVYQMPVSLTEVPVVMVSAEEIKKNSEEKLKEVQKALKHITSGKLTIDAEVRFGNTLDELDSICQQVKPFAVIIGTKGKSALERVLFGNTALAAIKRLTCPLICVPPGIEFRGIKKIGFACDFQQVVETTPTTYIKEFTRRFGATLHVLNVDHENKQFKPETPQQSVLLHTLLADANPSYHFIDNPDLEAGINEFAETNNLDLLITIPKKHNRIAKLFRTSDTKHLVFHSHIPVMCVHE